MEYRDIIVDGVETNYQISECGDVLNKSTGRLLKSRVGNNGYKIIDIYVGVQKKRTFTIHKLVATAFVENPMNKPTVNHDDGDVFNNHYKNLIWATYGENNQHAYDTGLKTVNQNHNFASYSDEKSEEICKLILKGLRGVEICEKLGIEKSKGYPYISLIKKGKLKKQLMNRLKTEMIFIKFE